MDEFIRRDKKDKALFYVAFIVFDAYYMMNKPEWIDQENREYRNDTEKHFAAYYRKHKEMWDSIPQNDKMLISNQVRGRSVMEGMQMENVTIDAWLAHVESMV